MIGISNRLTGTAAVLAGSLLCSCSQTSAYVPNQSATGQAPAFTIEQARNEILAEALPPVYFFDKRNESRALHGPNYRVSKIYLTNANMTVVTGYKTYNIPLATLNPSTFRDDSDGNEYVEVDISNVQGFYAYEDGSGQEDGLYHWLDSTRSERFTDALLALKSAAIKFNQDDEARFQEAAQIYRTVAPKPQLPEAAHRLEVQAEGAVRDKDFYSAAQLYEQAIKVAPWWPVDHFNRALALSGFGDFLGAITEMNRYLVLAPDASDARAAQDKIYDWQRKASAAD